MGPTMKRSQLATLMTITLYLAMGLGALLNPGDSWIWLSTIYTLTAFVMTTATLMAFIKSGRQRVAWTGFATFGWAYLLLCFRESADAASPHLVTTWLIRLLNETSHASTKHFSNERGLAALTHSVLAIVSGLIGSRLAIRFAGESSHSPERGTAGGSQ